MREVIYKVVPYKVVIQAFGRNSVKPVHEVLQPAMIVVYVLYMIDSFLGFSIR